MNFAVEFFLLLCLCFGIGSESTSTSKGLDNNFYLILEGFGPTEGQDLSSIEVQWALNTSWSNDYLGVSANWDASVSSIKMTSKELNWTVYSTVHASDVWNSHFSPPPNISLAMETLINAGIPENEIIWEYICEDDSAGTGFSQQLLNLSRKSSYSNGATKLSPSEALTNWEAYIHNAYNATLLWKETYRIARMGFPSNAHSLIKISNRIVIETANDDVGSLPPALAFLRGAVQQYQHGTIDSDYQKSWGIDLSMWWGVIDGCVNPLPASLHRRILWNSYFAGASLLSIEGCGYFDHDLNTPYPITSEIDEFGKFIKETLSPSNRGIHDSTVAIILAKDNGWSERPTWSRSSIGSTLWNYGNLPGYSKRGSGSVDGFFTMAYPGVGGVVGFNAYPFGKFKNNEDPPPSPFARSSISEKYAPDINDIWCSDSSLNFGKFNNRTEASNWFLQNKIDPAPFRPMADTRWGDIIDVWIDDLETISGINNLQYGIKYKTIIWFSSEMIEGKMLKVLESYIRSGGNLIIHVGSMQISDMEKISGISLTGNIHTARGFQFLTEDLINNKGGIKYETINIAEVANVQNAEVIAESVPSKLPIVIRKRLGHGAIYTSMVPFYEGGVSLSTVCMELFDRLIALSQPVTIEEGIHSLFWTSSTFSSKNKEYRYIAISNNNNDGPWKGTMKTHFEGKCRKLICKDIRKDTLLKCWKEHSNEIHGASKTAIETIKFAPLIDSFDVTAVSISCFH